VINKAQVSVLHNYKISFGNVKLVKLRSVYIKSMFQVKMIASIATLLQLKNISISNYNHLASYINVLIQLQPLIKI